VRYVLNCFASETGVILHSLPNMTDCPAKIGGKKRRKRNVPRKRVINESAEEYEQHVRAKQTEKKKKIKNGASRKTCKLYLTTPILYYTTNGFAALAGTSIPPYAVEDHRRRYITRH